MSDDDLDERPRRWPALLLFAAALVWLGAAAAITTAGAQDYATLSNQPVRESLVIFGSFVLQMLPPLAVAVLALQVALRQRPQTHQALLAIEQRHGAAMAATLSIARDLEAVDTMLDRIGERVAALRDAAAVQGGGLSASATHLDTAAGRLVESATRARDAGLALTDSLPEADARAQRLTTLLDNSGRESKRQLGELETMLTGLAAATEDAGARHQAAVAGAQERLAALGTLADRTAARVGEQGAALRADADAALIATTAALDTTRAGVDAQTASLLASVDQARVALDHIGGEAMRVMQGRLDRLLEAADTLGQSLSEQDARSKMFIDTVERSFQVLDAKLGNATAAGNAVLDTLSHRMDGVRETVHRLGDPLGVTQGVVGEIEDAVARLQVSASAAIRSLGSDLPASHGGVRALAEDVGLVRDHLAALIAPVDMTHATVQRIGAGLVEARAAAADVEAATGTGAVSASTRLIEVLARVRDAVDHFSLPLAGTQATVGEIEASVARLQEAATAAIRSLGSDLPASHDGVRALADDVGAVRDRLTALIAPVDLTDAVVERIAGRLTDARAIAADVETATGTGAVTASNQLIEVLGRVREVAAATAGTMRETLDAVVAEAQQALHEAGGNTARAAFGDPIRAELEAVKAATDRAASAAQGASDRVSQRLLGLAQTVATVEARIDQVDTAYDVKLRDDLARRSQDLVVSLNAAAIDIAHLLEVEVGDAAWTDYLRGDRGVFARRAAKLLDAGSARKISRHFSHDDPFREQVVRFITEFETLLGRVNTDREGKALAVTLLTSDIGKLYVVLAEATGKLR